MSNFEPTTSDDPDALPEPPLARASDWVEVELDLPGPAWAGYGAGPRTYLRETNTMPQWAGSCWYYLRYLDPTNEDRLVDPEVERDVGAGHPARRHAEGRARRPLRRRRRARGAAPSLRALLAQGAVRPRARVDDRAVPAAGQPGHDPGRRRTPTHAACTSRPPRWSSATAASSTTASRSRASSGRSARA